MTNKSFNPMYLSALDILTGALGVFIILNFLNTRLAGTVPPAPKPEIAAKVDKPEQPVAKKPQAREYYNNGQRGTAKYKPGPPPQPEQAKPEPKPEPAQPQPPVEQRPENPTQEPVAVDLMKQTKGDITLLLQQEGLAKQTVEFMLQQGNKTWKPSRASKYQNEEFKYERNLNYFYQVAITPGVYEVYVRVKKRNATGGQPFALYGKIIQPGMKTTTHNFGTYAASSDDWVRAGTFTVLSNAISFKSALPPVTADQLRDIQSTPPAPQAPKTEPKKSGKWGR
ncbi:MAG: hypothetical protein JNK89_02545 [Saprospiraceae bacterium]|nr:hypothetical protein [Saprospiraceae bacterium]